MKITDRCPREIVRETLCADTAPQNGVILTH